MGNGIEHLARATLACGLELHREWGPGLLEVAYEALLAQALKDRDFHVERQKPIPLRHNGAQLDEVFRADLLIERQLLVELKSVEKLSPVHAKQVLTYLRLLNLPLGLLLNSGAATFKEGAHRVLNPRADMSKIRVWRDEPIDLTKLAPSD
jgi:iron complex transport system substrate-binding protein